jgi:hypothetical protein
MQARRIFLEHFEAGEAFAPTIGHLPWNRRLARRFLVEERNLYHGDVAVSAVNFEVIWGCDDHEAFFCRGRNLIWIQRDDVILAVDTKTGHCDTEWTISRSTFWCLRCLEAHDGTTLLLGLVSDGLALYDTASHLVTRFQVPAASRDDWNRDAHGGAVDYDVQSDLVWARCRSDYIWRLSTGKRDDKLCRRLNSMRTSTHVCLRSSQLSTTELGQGLALYDLYGKRRRTIRRVDAIVVSCVVGLTRHLYGIEYPEMGDASYSLWDLTENKRLLMWSGMDHLRCFVVSDRWVAYCMLNGCEDEAGVSQHPQLIIRSLVSLSVRRVPLVGVWYVTHVHVEYGGSFVLLVYMIADQKLVILRVSFADVGRLD